VATERISVASSAKLQELWPLDGESGPMKKLSLAALIFASGGVAMLGAVVVYQKLQLPLCTEKAVAASVTSLLKREFPRFGEELELEEVADEGIQNKARVCSAKLSYPRTGDDPVDTLLNATLPLKGVRYVIQETSSGIVVRIIK
jgi:hypothetical protein